MKFITDDIPAFSQPIVGNVYNVRGGHGARVGHCMVLLAITEKQMCLFMVLDRNGLPVGVTSYGLHAIEERSPVAFFPGIDELTFTMEPLK